MILLDEVEKAHPDVFNLLLQVLDDGRLTDSQGRTVDFRNSLVIMTSNVGSDVIQNWSHRDPSHSRQLAEESLRATFRPEFLNRIDDIVCFGPLAEAQLAFRVLEIQLAALRGGSWNAVLSCFLMRMQSSNLRERDMIPFMEPAP